MILIMLETINVISTLVNMVYVPTNTYHNVENIEYEPDTIGNIRYDPHVAEKKDNVPHIAGNFEYVSCIVGNMSHFPQH
jgi:hypothetical protein